MKELLLRMAHYNAWANAHFISILRGLDETKLDMEITSSFSSIRKTVLHVWGAEDIWMQRLQQVSKPVWNALSFEGDMNSLCDNWEASSSNLAAYIESLDGDDSLTKTIDVVNMKQERYSDEIAAILQHVVNHSSYHRGQLVTMLRQAGITNIPSTDMIAWMRLESTPA